MLDLSYLPNTPNTGGWKDRHRSAVGGALIGIGLYRPTGENAIVHGIGGWINYAEAHQARFGGKIGDDYMLGPAWAHWGFALRDLLNGDLGRLDGGTLDTIIHTNLAEQGFNPDEGAP